MAKNIVLCLDGTHNQIAGVNTNVWRLFTMLERSDDQLTYYDPGVGTLLDHRSQFWFRRLVRMAVDLAVATSLREKVLSAYEFLARNYEEGDRIYIFGFSRGAYTARAVAGAVRLFGLLKPEHLNLAPYLWQTFSDNTGRPKSRKSRELFRTAAQFRGQVSRKNVEIHFMGLWDTVSAFGFATRFKTLPNTRSNPSVKVVRQAAAIDEKRSFYRLNRLERYVTGQDYMEVWFTGYHSDVGGGIAPPEHGLGLLSLRWMVGEAEAHKIKVDADCKTKILSDTAATYSAPVHNSMDLLFAIAEFLPARVWNQKAERYRWTWPNWFRRRRIKDGAFIHWSVESRLADRVLRYTPSNLPEVVDVAQDWNPATPPAPKPADMWD